MFISATSSLVLCTYVFVLNLFYVLLYLIVFACKGGGRFKEAVSVLPVGLKDWKITTAQLVLANKFKNILRTFKAEILEIFKNTQPQSPN